MKISNLYARIPSDAAGNSLVTTITDHHSSTTGQNGETITLVSYFQKDLRIGIELNYIINKYVIFVENGNQLDTNTFTWDINIRNEVGTDITTDYDIIRINSNSQEFAFKLMNPIPFTGTFELIVACRVVLSGVTYNLDLVHQLLNVDRDITNFLNSNTKQAVLGNPTCTSFINNHLRDFIGRAKNSYGNYAHLVTGIIYKNILDHYTEIEHFGLMNNLFDKLFTNFNYVNQINNPTSYVFEKVEEVGMLSIKLPLVWMYFNQTSNQRRSSDLQEILQIGFTDTIETFTDYYLLSTFPKSAIKYVSLILKMLFEAFQSECDIDNQVFIYAANASSEQARKNVLSHWKTLAIKDLSSDDKLLKNILIEYYNGPQKAIPDTISKSTLLVSSIPYVLNHDWSPYVSHLVDWWPISKEQLLQIFPDAKISTIQELRISFNKFYKLFHLNTINRRAHFFAQVREEVGSKIRLSEDLYYSVDALLGKTYFKKNEVTKAEARAYGYIGKKPFTGPGEQLPNEEAIANRIYSNNYGNGSVASGDGWAYRGKGYMHLTWKENYIKIQNFIDKILPNSGIDIIKRPDDILTSDGAILSAMAFWSSKKLHLKADNGTTPEVVDSIIDIINKKTNSRSKRKAHFVKILPIFREEVY